MTISSSTYNGIPTDSSLSRHYHLVAIKYGKNGDFDSCDHFLNKALAHNPRSDYSDTLELMNIYISYAVMHKRMERYDKALAYYDTTLHILKNKAPHKKVRLADIYTNIANIKKQRVEYEEAENYYFNSLNLYKIAGNHEPKMAKTYNNLGSLYSLKKEYEKSIAFYKKCIALKKQHTPENIAKNYMNLALTYYKLKEYELSEHFYLLAKKSSTKKILDASIAMNMGLLYNNLERYNESLSCYQEAMKIYQEAYHGKHSRLSKCYFNIGDVYIIQGKYDKALENYQYAILSVSNNFDDKDVFSNPSPKDYSHGEQFVKVLSKKAAAFRHIAQRATENQKKTQYLKQALSTYQLSVQVSFDLHKHYSAYSDFIHQISQNNVLIDQTVETALDLYRLSKDEKYRNIAFEYTEKSKSLALLASLNALKAKQFGGIPENLLIKEDSLQNQIEVLKNQIYDQKKSGNPNQEKIALWQSKLIKAYNHEDSMITIFENQYPDYYGLKYDYRTIDVTTLQNRLQDDEAVIEYLLSDSIIESSNYQLITFVITKSALHIRQTEIDTIFRRKIKKLQQCFAIQSSDNVPREFELFRATADTLSKILIKPVYPFIENKKLVIISDDILANIPFDILFFKDYEKDDDYRSLPYLIKNHVIHYAYSATLYSQKSFLNRHRTGELLAIAPSYDNYTYSKTDSDLSAVRDLRSGLLPIPGVETEINRIAEITDAEVLRDEAANEANFKNVSSHYTKIHIAGHAIINDEKPMYSKLAFTFDNNEMEDGFLNTYEIYNMRLNADLVVLSACNTGMGKLSKGEGLISLGRGFMYAGVPTLVMTLWSIDDKSGSQLMTKFYEYLDKGNSEAEALRLAKIDFLKKADPMKAHPYFWAGYVSVGKENHYQTPGFFVSNVWLLALSVILLLIAGVIAGVRWQKSIISNT